MQELLLIVTYTAQPGMREQFVNDVTASGVLDAIRGEEGCLTYAYYYDTQDADRIILVERWASEEHQQVHAGQPQMARLKAIKEQYIIDTQVQRGLW